MVQSKRVDAWMGTKNDRSTKNADATSPTVSTEAVLISVVINAYKERDVALVDIPGA